ncbi:MAG: PD-(D/E)XK nuclease family protein [Actinomycetia bacterium]|nr:PD-(D/E)XK nuclease family protein [Actinomycetes bacterium]
MPIQRLTTPYGGQSLRALRTAIDQVQAGDPLAAVTVLVHSNAVGVSARRWLAANGGIAAAQFLTAFRFAELLGGAALAGAGKRPVSTPVVDVAVRQVLASSAGVFQPIAHHQATITAVRNTYKELRHLPDAAITRLATNGSVRAREVVRLHRAIHGRLTGEWYDEADLLHAACTAAAIAPPRTIVFLPQRLRATEAALIDALGAHGEVVVLEGTHQLPSDLALEVVDASDADEEAREAVRVAVNAVHDGIALHRIGIVWPRHEPYARLVGEHLQQAGIAWNGRPGVALHERLAARLVLDVLQLDRRGIRRADLFALLASVPARTSDRKRVPRQRWERISRDAGLAGDADWTTRLTAYAAMQRAYDNELDAAAAEQLLAFVDDLRAQLGARDQARPWQHWARVARTLLHRWLGGLHGESSLPPEETEALIAVQASLDRLERLDSLAEPCTRAVFASTLDAELESAPGRVGRIGVGVHVGPLSFAVGQPFDLLVVVGAADGLLPAPPPPEALLGDSDRQLTDGALALNADSADEQRGQLWAAIAGAARVVLVAPRGDLRATALRQPSRWIGELAATVPTSTRSVPSFAAGLADTTFPATQAQHRVRALVHARRSGVKFVDDPLVKSVAALRAGSAMLTARAAPQFTEYDGNLAGLPIEAFGDRAVSPTRLEAWVACPHAWFMQYVLNVDPVEQPDEQLRITPRDRGNLVHRALDRFHQRVLAGELPQPSAQGWGPTHFAGLLAAFEFEAQLMAANGMVGRTAFWHAEQSNQRHELHEWLRADSALIAERGSQLVASEQRFGSDELPVVIALPDGSALRLRGMVDRIDRRADGTLVVTDHKTGKSDPFKDVSDDDPTAGGSKLQLPAYGAAALALGGLAPGSPVHAEYGFLAKGQYGRIGAEFNAPTWQGVGEVLQGIAQGIQSGLFIALPEKSQFRRPGYVTCEYCDPDHLGTAELWAEFERKQLDPSLVPVLRILGADDATELAP